MYLSKKLFNKSIIALFSIFLISCGTKENQRVKFALEKDAGYTPSMVWQKFQDIPLERTGIFNAGITPHLWWMKVDLKANKNETSRYFFKLNNPHINRLIVYEGGQDTAAWILGDNFPFPQRPFLNRDLVIPLQLEAMESISLLILLDKKGETLLVEPELLTEEEFLQIGAIENLFMGLFIGWMLIIFFAACFFAWNLREISALFYALFIISTTMWLCSHWGLGFQYLWPENLTWTDKSRPVFNILTNVLFLFLLLSFFPPLKKKSKLTYGIYFFIALHLFLIIDSMFRPLPTIPVANKMLYLRLTFGFSIFLTFLTIYYLLRQMRAKVPYAGYYLSGISILIMFNALLQLHQSGISVEMPNFMYDFGSSFGILGETIFITAAFASRAAAFKKEKELLSFKILQKEKEVADRLIQVQEDERNRLARDLHDSIGGMLASIYLEADKIGKQPPSTDKAGHLKLMIKQSMDEVRSISHNLTPPHLEELGLEKALQNHVQLVAEQNQLKINYYYSIKENLSKALQLMLYRICGELLYNVVKHAMASEVMVQLVSVNYTLEIIVEDDGKGMETKKKTNGIGLKNMRERVKYLKGEIHIDSNNQGTTVIIKIPFNPKSDFLL
jgi:signal transduction histidine kinase